MAQTRVGIRNGALVSPSSGIITDGLVLNLDASNVLSYPGTGTEWFDLTSNNNDGVLVNGPTYLTDNGGVMSFDGVNDRFISNNNLGIVGNTKRTVEIWFKPSSDIGRQTLVSMGNANSDKTFQIEYNGYAGGPNNVYFAGWNNDRYTLTTLPLNTWSYITVTYGGGIVRNSDGVKIYYNGVPQTLSGSGSRVLNTTDSKYYVGYDGILTRQHFNGNISNVRIYDDELTESQIQQNYNALKSRFGL